MINKPPPFTGLNIRIPIIIPTKGEGFMNHGFTFTCLGFRVQEVAVSWLEFAQAHSKLEQKYTLNPKP